MKNLKYIGIGLLIVLAIAAVIFYPKYKMLTHTIHLFDEDRIVENFRSFDAVWPISDINKSSNPYTYPKGSAIDLPAEINYRGKSYTGQEFLKDSRTTGFIVIQNDSIVYENYFLGNTETTRNISWSMAKSFISALVGIAVDEGHIESVMQNVDDYCPILKGSGYEGVTIKDVLQMSTGVAFNEDYGDFNSDINRWGRGFALGQSQDEFAATLVICPPPDVKLFAVIVAIDTGSVIVPSCAILPPPLARFAAVQSNAELKPFTVTAID